MLSKCILVLTIIIFGCTKKVDKTTELKQPVDVSIVPNGPSPVLEAIGNKSVIFNNSLTFKLKATDPNGRAILFSVDPLPSAAFINSVTGDFLWIPSCSQSGVHKIRFIATNDNQETDYEDVMIQVANLTDKDCDNYDVNHDCDDLNPNVHSLLTGYLDLDSDGYGTGYFSGIAYFCSTSLPQGYSLNNSDCDDTDNTVHNYIYYNYTDIDDDGYTFQQSGSFCALALPKGYTNTPNGSDCDDHNKNIYQNISYNYRDMDMDGYTVSGSGQICSGATLPDTYRATSLGADCNDSDPTLFTNRNYTYRDKDNDGYTIAEQGSICSGNTLSSGYFTTAAQTDCNDNNVTLNTLISGYIDNDGDGFGSGTLQDFCANTLPSNYVTNNTDCDDTNNAKFQNLSYSYRDMDLDGYTISQAGSICTGNTLPITYTNTSAGDDCDDNNANKYYLVFTSIDYNDAQPTTKPSILTSCRGSGLPANYNKDNFSSVLPFSNSGTGIGSYHLTTDNNGNRYITGNFQGTIDFNPSANDEDIISSSYTGNVYITKINNIGTYAWTKVIVPQNYSSHVDVYDISTDSNGNVFLVGYINGNVDLDPAESIDIRSSINTSGTSGFVVKLSSSGSLQWAKIDFSGYRSFSILSIQSVQIDINNNILISVRETVSIGSNSYYTTHMKLDNSGNIIWSRMGCTYNNDSYTNVRIISADSQSTAYSFESNSPACIIKFNNAGEIVWQKNITADSFDARSISFDTSDNIIISAIKMYPFNVKKLYSATINKDNGNIISSAETPY